MTALEIVEQNADEFGRIVGARVARRLARDTEVLRDGGVIPADEANQRIADLQKRADELDPLGLV
jgi:hypothetical protein